MSFDYQVHRPVKGGAEHQVTTDPYIQITGADGSYLLRYGKFWSADGVEVSEDDIPDWVIAEIGRMTAKGRASVGFEAYGAVPSGAKPAPAKPSKSV
jgi:hypothetical protein